MPCISSTVSSTDVPLLSAACAEECEVLPESHVGHAIHVLGYRDLARQRAKPDPNALFHRAVSALVGDTEGLVGVVGVADRLHDAVKQSGRSCVQGQHHPPIGGGSVLDLAQEHGLARSTHSP